MSHDYQAAVLEASAGVNEGDRDVFAKEIAKCLTVVDSASNEASLKELREVGEVGQPRRIVSRKLKNVLFNWKKVLTEAVPALIQTVAAWQAKDSGGYLSALQFFQSIRGLTNVDLSDDHGKVVRFLWVEQTHKNPVEYEDLSDGVSGKLEKVDLTTVLEDLLILELISMDSGIYVRKIDEFVFE